MEVILKKNVANLGYKGDIVNVKPGYANNYLIPNELAMIVNEANKKSVSQDILQAAHKVSRIKEIAEEKSKKTEAIVAKIKVSAVNDENKIFGTITPLQISQAYLEHDLNIEPKSIIVKTPIKTLGIHEISIQLHKEVTCNGKIEILKG